MFPNTLPQQHPSFLKFLHQQLNADKNNKLVLAASPSTAAQLEIPKLCGKEIYPRLKTLVENANTEILLMGYKLDGGSDGETDLLEALKNLSEKAKQKGTVIRVRILINQRKGFSGIIKPDGPSTSPLRNGLQLDNIDLEYAEHQHYAFGSFHSKMVVVDSQAAMLMSCDLMKQNNYKDGKSRWTDMASILHGESLVSHIRKDFIQAWNSDHAFAVSGKKSTIPEEIQIHAPAHLPEKTITVQAMFLSKKANGALHTRQHMSPYTLGVIEAIKQAKSSISITTPNLNESAVLDALADANQRGVNIYIALDKYKNNDAEALPFAGGTNQQGIEKLYKKINKRGNLHPDKLHIRWTTNEKGQIIALRHDQEMHARMVCVDDIVFIGSSVLDKQSVYHSRECDVVMQSPEAAELYLDTIFRPIFAKGKEAIMPGSANDLGWDIENQDLLPLPKENIDEINSLIEQCKNNIRKLDNQSLVLSARSLTRKLTVALKEKLDVAQKKGEQFNLKQEYTYQRLIEFNALLSILNQSPPQKQNTVAYTDYKKKKLIEFENNSKKNACGWAIFGKLIGIFLITAAAFIAGATIGAAISGALTSLTGPGAIVGAVFGALSGGNAATVSTATTFGLTGLVCSTYFFFKPAKKEETPVLPEPTIAQP